jgi:hypothetical protein
VLDLPGQQLALVQQIAATGKPVRKGESRRQAADVVPVERGPDPDLLQRAADGQAV